MVVVGLALRYVLNRPAKSKAKPTPVVHEQPRPTVDEPKPVPDQPPPREPEPAPEPPPPPRIAGATQISDAETQHFATGPGVIYYCEAGGVMAQPKTGGPPKRIGDCESAFDFMADAQGVFYCDGERLMRISAGTEGSHAVAEGIDCILSALDAKYAYFVVPGFEGNENPGVYRVVRTGGTPERIHATRPKEQFALAVDNDVVWISAWSAGTISKLAKTPNAKARTVVTGQKGIVDFGIDATSLYWYAEGTGEVRRRKKTGGAIEVIGHDVDQEPIAVVDGHAYWFEGGPGQDKRLMHLAPGGGKAEQLAAGLHVPTLRADAEGVYISELDRDGIFMFKR